MTPSASYRPEIDGLRAIAVAAVILYHAKVGALSGGFVGVDIFFVISGYLITGILLDDIGAGRFSIARFYERRARRILPALVVVVLATLPFAWAWMLPEDLSQFARSLLFVAMFLANIHFIETVDYFAPSAELQPLLHTWSLAIEEQFYLLLPFLLFWLRKTSARTLGIVLMVTALASLAVSEWGWRTYPDDNFFFTLSRFWELLAGSLAVLVERRTGQRRSGLVSLAGLVMLMVPLFLFDDTVPSPSVMMLLPVAGAALVLLYARDGTPVARLLSLRPLVGLGLISYSAYLWHQPLFAFAKIRLLGEPPTWLYAVLILATLVLAAVTWRWVEQPFRRSPRFPASRSALFGMSGFAFAALAAIGIAGFATGGFPSRMPEQSALIAKFLADRNPNGQRCQSRHGVDPVMHPKPGCTDFMPDGVAEVAIVGDSHANAIAFKTQTALMSHGIPSYAYSISGCMPFPGVVRVGAPPCNDHAAALLDHLEASGTTILVVSSRYVFYWDGHRFDNGEGGLEAGPPSFVDIDRGPLTRSLGLESAERRAAVLKAYTDGIESLADRFQVVLVYPVPEIGWDVPRRMVRAMMLATPDEVPSVSSSTARFLERNGPVIAAFDAIDHPNIRRVRPQEVFCDTWLPGRCVAAWKDQAFYVDDDHLSGTGAALVAPLILEQVEAFRATAAPALTK